MSYEPTLIIRKADLEKHRSTITEGAFKNIRNLKKQAAYSEAYKALNATPIVFTEISIVLITPEFTDHNKAVRDLLNELKIEYKTQI